MAQKAQKEMDFKNTLVVFKEMVAKSSEPVIGVEYLIYFEDDYQNPYVCTLCSHGSNSKKGNAKNMIFHAITTTHRLKVISLEAPSVHKELIELSKLNDTSYDFDFQDLLKRISKKIFKHKQILTPYTASKYDFKSQKLRLINRTKSHEPCSERVINRLLEYVEGFKRKREDEKVKAAKALETESMNQIYHQKVAESTAAVEAKYSGYFGYLSQHPNIQREWQYYYLTKKFYGNVEEALDPKMWKTYFVDLLRERKRIELLEVKVGWAKRFGKSSQFEDECNELENFQRAEDLRWEWFDDYVKNIYKSQKNEDQKIGDEQRAERKSEESFCSVESKEEIFETPLRKVCPVKRKLLVDMEEIEAEVLSKISRLDDELWHPVKIETPTDVPSESRLMNEPETPPTPDSQEFDGIKLTDVWILFAHNDKLTENDQISLNHYLEKLRHESPEKYERLVNMEVQIPEITNTSSQEGNASMETDDDYSDKDLVESVKVKEEKNAEQNFDMPCDDRLKNVTKVSYVDLTVDG